MTMINRKLNISVLYWPSIRSIAYLQVFRDLGIVPSKVYFLEGDNNGVLEPLMREAKKYDYCKLFFDVNFNINSFMKENEIDFELLPTSNINDKIIVSTLQKDSHDYILFTGGGVLKKEILNVGEFIHVHPGILPEFRGSTCFYFSLLTDGQLGSTAIFLNENIDEGNIIEETRFKINYFVSEDQPLFTDYILDPYIRAFTLKKLLVSYRLSGSIKGASQTQVNAPTYYVMHPLLRHKAIMKLNRLYSPEEELGIFENV